MVILLDIDGVMITTPAWKQTEQMPDGFLKFDPIAEHHLKQILLETNASIVLTSTHRISFPTEKWEKIFSNRGFNVLTIQKINNKIHLAELHSRAEEIEEWANLQKPDLNYVIIDDDLSLHGLPNEIKNRWVQTKPLLGFDENARLLALKILMAHTTFNPS